MKKVFIISAVLLLVTLIFLGIYNFAFKKETVVAVPKSLTNPIEESGASIPTPTEKIKAISDSGVIGPVFDKKNGEIKYYDAATSFVWKMNPDGSKKQQISSTSVLGLKKVLWSQDLNRVLTVTEKDGKNFFYMYDYTTKQGTLLKSGLDTAVWDNLGVKIFYKYFDEKTAQRSLNISNSNGGDFHKIADIIFRNISIAPVPLTSAVSFWNFPNQSEETLFQSVGVDGGEPKTILKGQYGADYLWAPDGSRALVSSLKNKENKMVTLGIVFQNGIYQDLNIPTLVSKCTWSMDSKTVYYALPGGIPTESIMPNDYQENKFNTDDTFWKLEVATGRKERVIEASEINGKYDSSQLFLAPEEDGLYFINRADKKLYLISW